MGPASWLGIGLRGWLAGVIAMTGQRYKVALSIDRADHIALHRESRLLGLSITACVRLAVQAWLRGPSTEVQRMRERERALREEADGLRAALKEAHEKEAAMRRVLEGER